MEKTDSMIAAFAPHALEAASRAVFLQGLAQAIGAVVLIVFGVWLMGRGTQVTNGEAGVFCLMCGGSAFLIGIILLVASSTWLPLIDPQAAVAARFM